MAGEWINRKARDMCNCLQCQPDGSLNECMRGTYESGIRAGLKHAAELCGVRADEWAKKYDSQREQAVGALDEAEACERAIRDLLTPGASHGR